MRGVILVGWIDIRLERTCAFSKTICLLFQLIAIKMYDPQRNWDTTLATCTARSELLNSDEYLFRTASIHSLTLRLHRDSEK